MKKLVCVFLLCAVTLFSINLCYAGEMNKAVNITEDLPLVLKFESTEGLNYLNEYNIEVQAAIAEQCLNLNILNCIFYLNSYQGSFDGSSLLRSMKENNAFVENAPIYKSEIYKNFYKLRTEKLLKKYETTEIFDYTEFIKMGRQEFNSYIKNTAINESSRKQLTVLLQAKLADKLIELEPSKRKALWEEILALRLPANVSKNMDCVYQILESRVRAELLSQMVEKNKIKLEKLTKSINIVITAERQGQLLLQSKDQENKDKAVQIINVLGAEEGYRGLALLNEFYSKPSYKLIFTEADGTIYEIDEQKVLSLIKLDENGILHMNLNVLFTEKTMTEEVKVPTEASKPNVLNNRLKSMEHLYNSKTKAAQEIIKELNRYSIYLELKDKRISNYYTRSFDANKSIWKKNLESKLNSFGADGMADFMAYIKQFELLDRKPDKQAGEKLLIARFRNSDAQFRKTENFSIWVTNVLFNLKYMQ